MIKSLLRVSVAAMIGVILFWITTVEGARISPFGLCTGAFLLLSWPVFAKELPRLARRPEVLWAAVAHLFLFFGPFYFDGVNGDTIRTGLRTLMMFWAVLSLAAYVAASSINLRHAILVFAACLWFSQLWYAGEIVLGEPFVSLRIRLYSSHYAAFPDLIDTMRSGLAPFLHQLGYQSCAASSILLCLSLMHPSAFIRWLCLTASAFMIAVMMTTAMRSPVLACLLSTGICLAMLHRRLPGGKSVLALSLVFAVAWAVYNAANWLTPMGTVHIADKLDVAGAGGDILPRLRVQWNTLLLLFSNPLGLTGQQYFEEAFWVIFSDPSAVDIGAMSVHNGYLSGSVTYGLAFLVVCVGFLISFTHGLLTSLRALAMKPCLSLNDILQAAILCAAVGLYYPQAMLHNASIMTQEPTSMLIFGLSVGIFLGLAPEIQRSALAVEGMGSPRRSSLAPDNVRN